MKLLLDECITRYLKADLSGIHEVFTIDEAGFKGLKNGRLLEAMASKFDVLITVDKSISKQQNRDIFISLNLSVLVLRAKTNRYEDLKILAPQTLEALQTIETGEVVEIENRES